MLGVCWLVGYGILISNQRAADVACKNLQFNQIIKVKNDPSEYKKVIGINKEAGQIPALSRSGRPWQVQGKSDRPL